MKSLREICRINGTSDSYIYRPIVTRWDRLYYQDSDGLLEPLKKAIDEKEELLDLLVKYMEESTQSSNHPTNNYKWVEKAKQRIVEIWRKHQNAQQD